MTIDKKTFDELPKLSSGIKHYVAQGVYGMYSLKNYPASYILYMNRSFPHDDSILWTLNKEGIPIKEIKTMDKKYHKDIVIFITQPQSKEKTDDR